MRLILRWFLCSSAVLSLGRSALAQSAQPREVLPHAAVAAPAISVERNVGAQDCPDEASLQASIAGIRGQARAPDSARYAVLFARAADAYAATILSGPNGESRRVLEEHGASCSALAQATAVTLALLLDADLDSALPSKPAPALAPPKLVPVASERRPAAARNTAQVDGTLALGGAALFGALRPVAPALSGELGVRVARFRAGLGALWVPTQSLPLDPGSVRESLLAGSARACFGFTRVGKLRIEACSGLLAGTQKAEGRGFTVNAPRSRSWLAVPLEIALTQLDAPIGWEHGASALGVLAHDDFAVDGLGTAYRSSRWAGMLSLRIVGLWPW